MLSSIEYLVKPKNETLQNPIDDFAPVLQSFGLSYTSTGIHYQVGAIKATQGWIIHLSIILSQVKQLLGTIIPYLANQHLAFKIPTSSAVCEDISSGNLGIAQIGKIVGIYCENARFTPTLAKELILLTKPFKGPAIPTDVCLGNIVYTRYGGFNPIIQLDSTGIQRKYIYNEQGGLIEDSYEMPFRMPDRVTWPFSDLAAPTPQYSSTFLNRLYKVTGLLKQDPRGNVYTGLYLKNLLTVKKCVIKQGFSNMGSDPEGRDIQERLRWQNELYTKLADTIPLPKIYGIYQEQGFTVLIMEYIKGCSLLEKLAEINPLSKHWKDLATRDSTQILKYAIEIVKYIDAFHRKGYIHRDINPVNFMIDKEDKVILIDIELAYSTKDNRPNPPFRQGTPGFMSPQQENFHIPTIHDDIYSLGATLLYIFTGLLPVQCNFEDSRSAFENLSFLIGTREIADLISKCLHTRVEVRPSINTIIETLKVCDLILVNKSQTNNSKGKPTLDISQLKDTISSALRGMSQPPVIVLDDVWLSKQVTADNPNPQKANQFALSRGTSEGVPGILYVLARVYSTGISVDPCMQGFDKGWQTLKSNLFNCLIEMPRGLYKGTAGIALALAEGINSGLLEDNKFYKEKILECLESKTYGLDVASGISGQGVSVLNCKKFLKKERFNELTDKIIQELLERQRKDGLWLYSQNSKQIVKPPFLDMAYDDVGIAIFLLDYLVINSNSDVRKAVTKAILSITGNKRLKEFLNRKIASKNGYEFGDGGKGIILLLIKAYDVLHEENYKKIAFSALHNFPPYLVHPNFTQANGLAAIGELYLEAYRVFKNEEWKNRAGWIANTFIHTLCRNQDSSGYWVLEQNTPPTADFLTGISGIIHFLARIFNPDKLGYRLFN